MSTSPYARRNPQWRVAGVWSAGFVGVLWLSEIIDTVLDNRLDREGIRPGSSEGLLGILFAPLLHGGFGHLIANTVPLLVLGFPVLLSGLRQWLVVTAAVWLIGGFRDMAVRRPGHAAHWRVRAGVRGGWPT
ncbi:rhomboid family intramembrane serine protease [Nocardioides sp. B-3]|uniref:rhomboid family intramembrane serine protease n=1 Tax=Nocardioides sp. B-3 TaxID=2895565 RepID=UPI002152A7C9|nr:rhomboid family intramembrane serine protease [Nocardioides sp. B-3]UUZ57682.1 rhomboid family intramembrane serine protease [Nocardioides sp. B-3]